MSVYLWLYHTGGRSLQDKEAPKISKKKLRKMNRLSVAQLKQLVERPDVVEMQDVTAQDPRLLIHLKVREGRGQLCAW